MTDISQYKTNITPGNFGGVTDTLQEQASPQLNMLQSMYLPSTPDEFVKFIPHMAGGIGVSYAISKLASMLVNAKGNHTADESFKASKMNKITRYLDDLFGLSFQKIKPYTDKIKVGIVKYTPSFFKNIAEKMKIGVRPELGMAQSQFKGLTNMSVEYAIDNLRKLPPERLKALGVEHILSGLTAKSLDAKQAFEQISKKLGSVSDDLLKYETPKKFWKFTLPEKIFGISTTNKINIAEEINKTRGFVANNAKTPISKALQKFTMCASEAAGGAVVGGGFGMIMNAVFVAAGINRTWNAPKGEKLSTAMEVLFADFIGMYLMMMLATKLNYHLLGIKNLDKTKVEIKAIEGLIDNIKADKTKFKEVNNLINSIKAKGLTKETQEALKQSYGITANSIDDVTKALQKHSKSPTEINQMIDQLAKMKKFKGAGTGFVNNFINRPLTWLGKVCTVGLDRVPVKVADGVKISKFRQVLGNLFHFGKGFGGGALRFGLIMFVLTPPFTKMCLKLTHSIFGRPSKSLLDDMEEDKKKKTEAKKTVTPEEQARQAMIMNTLAKVQQAKTPEEQKAILQQLKQEQQQEALAAAAPVSSQVIQSKVQQQVMQPQIQNPSPVVTPTVVPAAPQVKENIASRPLINKEDEGTYLPSSEAAVFAQRDMSKIAGMLGQSEQWEQNALNQLNEIKKNG